MVGQVFDSASEASSAAKSSASVSTGTKLAYGIGGAAYGIKDNGVAYFLLLFYSQVIGIDPLLVGPALTIALMIDGICDPIIGFASDNLRSKWGRRHPFMYASAIPVAISFLFIWNPPTDWSHGALFWYLLVFAVLLRISITLYETPSAALAAELSEKYDERSSLLSYRTYFAWTGGNTMSVAMFWVIFPLMVTPAISNGQFNRESYTIYSIVGAVIMVLAIVVSAAGTHSQVPFLKAPPPKRMLTISTIFKELRQTLATKSFLALFVATIFGAVGAGLSAALAFYFLAYFWEFTTLQSGAITFGVFGSAIIGAFIAPLITKKLGKKRGAIIVGLAAFIGSPVPVMLRVLGLLPENGTPFIFWFVFLTSLVDVGLIICFQILAASMIADLVEEAELKTGHRSEGVFFSAVTFVRKMVTGLGVMMSGWVLSLAHFPAGAKPGQVSAESIWLLGLIYAPTILALWMAMMAAISTYKIDRDSHERNLALLAVRRRNSVATE